MEADMRWIAVVAAVAFPALAWAHDGHDHGADKMMGTVTAVHAEMNHVQMTDGKTDKAVDFYVDAKTKILKGATALTLQDLKPGTRIVVSGKTEGERMLATEVKVGDATKETAPPAPHKH
jgi:hypothetical protein